MAAFSIRRILYYFSTCNIDEYPNNHSPVAQDSWLRKLVDATITRIQQEQGSLSGVHKFLLLDETELANYDKDVEDDEEQVDEEDALENIIFDNQFFDNQIINNIQDDLDQEEHIPNSS